MATEASSDPPGHGWPALRVADWVDTRDTLHMWTQIVGKIRLKLAPHVNHWWQVPLYLTARGLTTTPIPYGDREFDVTFDFIDHVLVIQTSDGRAEPSRATRAIARGAKAAGAVIASRTAVRGVESTAGRVAGIVTEHGRVAARAVVCAAGAWTRLFCGSLGIRVPQLPVLNSVARTAPAPELLAGQAWSPAIAIRRRADGGYTVAHGHTSCVMLPAVLAYNEPVNGARQAVLAAQMGRPGVPLSRAVADLVRTLGLPGTLRELGIDEPHFGEIAQRALDYEPVQRNPRPIRSADDVRQILHLAR